MRTELTRALDFLGEPGVRFRIPVYQRVYSWTRPQCEELWADLMQAAAADEDHFMGTVLSGAPDAGVDAAADAACALCADAGVRAVDLVDGQQRMVTLTLLLSALCSALAGTDDEQLRAQAADLAERCLFVRADDRYAEVTDVQKGRPKLHMAESDGDVQKGRPKLHIEEASQCASSSSMCNLERPFCTSVLTGSDVLTKMELAPADQPTFSALLREEALPEGDGLSANLADNCRFFRERLASAADVRQALSGLRHLTLISAQLEAGDEPQSVFESLNSKGKGLTSADLIRNLLLARFGCEDQQRLYEQLWQPIEGMFADNADAPDLLMDAALHAWLEQNADGLDIQDRSELYGAFKRHVLAHPEQPLEDLLASVNAFCAQFAEHLDSHENKVHVDWAKGKLTGLVSERKLFGD